MADMLADFFDEEEGYDIPSAPSMAGTAPEPFALLEGPEIFRPGELRGERGVVLGEESVELGGETSNWAGKRFSTGKSGGRGRGRSRS
jgi:hypothetical protein